MTQRAHCLILALWSIRLNVFIYGLSFSNEIGKVYDDKVSVFEMPCPEEPRCKCQAARFITKSVTIANCRNASLTAIPKLPNNTYMLDLSQNKIQDLGENQFANYTMLIILNITQNNITEIKAGAFERLANLQRLSLRGNKIRYNATGFQPNCFKPLSKLTHLNILQDFSRNDFRGEGYELEALSELPQLRTIYLDGIHGMNLSDALKYLPSLERLYFSTGWNDSRCRLPTLKENFFPNDTIISYVTLSYCDINMIEAGTFQILKNLTYLDLSHNMDLTFKSMKNISVGLDSTQISVLKLNKVHKTFGSCVEITKEHLEGFSNTNLKMVYLESNRISLLDKRAVKYIPKSLEMISVRDNIIMLGNYIGEFIIHAQNFNNLKKVIISDQSRNHFLSLRKRRDMSRGISSPAAATELIGYSNEDGNLINSSIVDSQTKAPVMYQAVRKDAEIGQIKRHDQNQWIGQNEDDEDALDEKTKEQIKDWMRGVPIPLPRNLDSLDASNMKIRLALYSKSLGPNKLRSLYLNRNIYWAWYGPFIGFENLTKLDLSWNSCNVIKLRVFEKMPSLKFLNLSRNYLDTSLNKDRDGIIFRNQGNLEILSISQNKIRQLPRNIFSGLKNIKMLFLARNLLKNFEVDLSHMEQLKRVNLYDNQLETISKSARDIFDRQALTTNLSLDIQGNNFKCDCTNMDFVKWVAESPVQFVNKQNYRCRFKDRTIGYLNDARRIYEALEKECYNYIPIIVTSTAALVLVISLTAAAVIYRYRWNLRYMYYMTKYKAKVPNRKGYESIGFSDDQIKDVNVSYADEDSGFIRQKIHSELEINRGLTLHIRDRDSPIAAVSENIVDAIERSRRTLIIMSKAYLKHKWCIFEMNMAGIKALKTDERLLCVLMLEDVPHRELPLKIMKIIKDQEHLEYPGDENLEDCFWDRLKSALTD